MIRAEDKFSVTKKGNKYVLSTKRDDKFEVLGTSFDLGVSVGAGNEYKFIMLELPEDAYNELIIVHVQGRTGWEPAFIMVDVRKEQPFNLKEFMFLPEVDATYNFLGKYIEVRISGVIYTSDPENKNPRKKYVNGNTFCRYLTKKATEKELMAEAATIAEEKSAREELSELRKELKEALSRLQDREDHVVELVHKLDDAKVELKNLQKNRDGVMDSYTDLRKVIEEIVSSYNNTFWNRTKSLSDIWKVLNNTASVHEYIDRERVINGDSWLVSKGIKIE